MIERYFFCASLKATIIAFCEEPWYLERTCSLIVSRSFIVFPINRVLTKAEVSGMVEEQPASTILSLVVSITRPIKKSTKLLCNRIIHRGLCIAYDINRIRIIVQWLVLLDQLQLKRRSRMQATLVPSSCDLIRHLKLNYVIYSNNKLTYL